MEIDPQKLSSAEQPQSLEASELLARLRTLKDLKLAEEAEVDASFPVEE